MKRSEMMRPIVLKGTEAANAVESAVKRSAKNGRAFAAYKKANLKPPVLSERSKH